MKCKYCDLVELHWPENWKKGMKPLEYSTNIEHTKTRCMEIKNRGKNHRKCSSCDTLIYYDKSEERFCSTCQLERFRN